MPSDRLAYRPDEAARVLGVGRSTLYQWIAEGRIKVSRPADGVTLISRAELERFLEETRIA